MMNENLQQLDLDLLQQHYDKAVADFKNSLLNGTPWEEVQEHRFQVSTLGIALYDRIQTAGLHPAEYGTRAEL